MMQTTRLPFILFSSMLMLVLTCVTAAAQNAERIIGKWKDADHPDKQVEMYAQGNGYWGKSITTKGKDTRNGTVVFKDLIWNEKAKVYKGTLVNPDNGEEFKIDIKLADNNTFQFKVKMFVFSKSFTFKRI